LTDGGVSGAALDREEVRRLYEQHGRALLAYACALLRDPSQAEDVLHHVFLRLLQDRVRTISSPGYLFRAVRNRALNHVRDRSRDVELDETAQWLESPSGSIETALALQSALGMLPEDQREVIALRVWGLLTFEEIGAVVDAPPNTAASRYRYGLAKLKEIWHGRT
jgi:RNA polymerase sigma-70 factor (ECF subfamily)